MKALAKTLYKNSPVWVKKNLLAIRDFVIYLATQHKEISEYGHFSKRPKIRPVRNVLIYHISGMYYAGTEKTLQSIANELVDDYNVYFMYSRNLFSMNQFNLLDPRIHTIEFSYSSVEKSFPYFIHGMTPHIKDVIDEKNIDILITSSTGHSQYPFNTIREIPIILLNIFGSPNMQQNILKTIFISKTILDYSEQFTGIKISNSWKHLPVAPPTKDTVSGATTRTSVRQRLSIPDDSFVFGRIGRGTNDIYDPIGILAFEKIVKENTSAHYLIMSPPPHLVEYVEKQGIPNIHYMTDKEDIWDFYFTIDALAHFRLDGETFGLNIAEAMHAGKPVISHKSHIWNAHLEYLTPEFSRVVNKDDVTAYALAMIDFLDMWGNNKHTWNNYCEAAKKTALEQFSRKKYGDTYKSIIQHI